MSSTMTVSSTSGITALLCSIVISVAVAQSEPRFRLKILTDSPTARSNFLRLQCQDGELGFLSNPDTLVWLNSTNLVDKTPVEDSYNDGQRVSVFIITQELEGVYTCGLPAPDGVNRPESAPQLILPYPEFNSSLPAVIPHHAATGSVQRIECAVQPGALVRNYFVTWKNASSGTSLINLIRGSLETQTRVDLRYSVAQDDFSLLINGVRPSDAGVYRCELGVGGGRLLIDEWYEQTKTINITLEVFDPPMIIDPPKPVSVALPTTEDQASGPDATYTCTATAADSYVTSLEILWEHNGVAANRDPDNYLTVLMPPRTSIAGVTAVTGMLTIRSPKIAASGNVVCTARIPPRVETGSVESVATASTTLSVLGAFIKYDPEITEDGTVIFDIMLSHRILTENRIRMEFTDATGEWKPKNRTTEAGFVNNSRILYLIDKPPFSAFTVRAGLISSDLTVVGPLSQQSKLLDINRKPLSSTEVGGVVAGVCVGVFIVLVFITAIVLIYVSKNYHRRKYDINKALPVAREMTTNAIRNGNTGDPAEMLARNLKIICGALSAIDSNEYQSRDVQDVPVDDVMRMLKCILDYSHILHEQGQAEVLKCVKTFLIQSKDKKLVIELFKETFDSAYDQQIINWTPMSEPDKHLFMQFVEDTNRVVKGGKF